ncbi:MAG: hypothetical protein LBP58_04545 [Azoarcus sp.]|jgi:hypothetical protein|nr:hypothetical protein [Azoarcus sp.]
MFFNIFRFCGIVVLWWVIVWYVLPADVRQLPPFSLVLLHVVPPLTVELTWFLSKRLRIFLKARTALAVAAAQEREQQAALDAAMAAHRTALQQRRTGVECRGVWALVPKVPDWYDDDGHSGRSALLEQSVEKVWAVGREAALLPLLQRVFEAAVSQSEAVAWLPVYVTPGGVFDAATQQALIEKAWQQAMAAQKVDRIPSRCDCRLLPGSGWAPDRAIALFDGDPSLSAFVLLGMDLLLDGTEEDVDSGAWAGRRNVAPGYAVAAVLLSRPGLVAQPQENAASGEGGEDESYTPYWERDQRGGDQVVRWGGLSQQLQFSLLALIPFATLRRPCSACCENPGRESELMRHMHHAVENVLINAGLRDLPFRSDSDAVPEPSEDAAPPEDAAPLKLGWLVHNAGVMGDTARATRMTVVALTLRDFGCEFDTVADASNVSIEYGHVGAARSVLMLSEALIRLAQRQKPVLAVEFGEGGNLDVMLVQTLEDA